MKSIIQKVQYLILAGLFGFVAVTPAYAAPGGFFKNAFGRLFPNVQQEANEATTTPKSAIPKVNGLREDAKNKTGTPPGGFRPALFARAAIGKGSVTAIEDSTTLTVLGGDGGIYHVLTDGKTQFRRRFWGKGSFAEIQVGDTVSVIGKWTDDTHTTIQATLVRDLSIQKFIGVFFGTVQSLTGSGWVMTTVNRGNQTVTASSATKFTDRTGQPLTQSDVVAGHRVRVRGLWDRKNNTITEVTAVKDFSLPLAPAGTVAPATTGTVTPTPTASPTPTATPTP